MKIGIAQINTTIGDFEGNYAKMMDRIHWAKINGVNLLVFPEMAITGYPPKDLLENSYFILKNLEVLNRFTQETTDDFAIVVGFVSANESTRGKGLFNSVALLSDGCISHVQHKTLLPTYDVFDEARYFEPASSHDIVEFGGYKIGLTVCEDLWFDEEFGGRKIYKVNPVKELINLGADLIINVSASPYVVEKRARRRGIITRISERYQVPVVYTNLVGGNDELVFDGSSMIADSGGKIAAECNPFVMDSLVWDISKSKNLNDARLIPLISNVEEVYKALILGLRDYISKCGFRRVVIGISGGIDSALVAALASFAVGPQNVIGIAMPSRYSDPRSLEVSKELVKNLNIPFKVIDIDNIYETYLKKLEPEFHDKEKDTTEENIQSRIRGNIIMAFSNKFDAMMLSTGNKSELAVGYCTLYGDLAGGLGVISDVPKTLVYKLARFINRECEIIPSFIIERPPTAELKPDQTDQDMLPSYEVLDGILKAYIEDHLPISAIVDIGYDEDVVMDVVKRISRSEYKRRQSPPGIKVTSKAFGRGRVYPVACKY